LSHTITATAGAGGTITPSGAVSVFDGASQTFTITKNTSYHIADVLVDGISVGAVPPTTFTYPFNNVVTDHTIQASFVKNSRVEFFYDGFESTRPSGNSWTETQTINWFTGTPKNGTHSVQMVGGTNPDSSILRTISTLGYSEIVVSYYMGAASLGNGKVVAADYSTNGGAPWTNLNQITNPGDGNLHLFTSPTLPTGADRNSAFTLRVQINANNNQYGYFDDVRVTGIPD
jgi:hypothetical protein